MRKMSRAVLPWVRGPRCCVVLYCARLVLLLPFPLSRENSSESRLRRWPGGIASALISGVLPVLAGRRVSGEEKAKRRLAASSGARSRPDGCW